MPVDYSAKIATYRARNEKIYAEHLTGVHPRALAIKYEISTHRVKQIIKDIKRSLKK